MKLGYQKLKKIFWADKLFFARTGGEANFYNMNFNFRFVYIFIIYKQSMGIMGLLIGI